MTYRIGHSPTERFVAVYSGRLSPATAPVVADLRVAIYASGRELAECCAEHVARDESWYLIALRRKEQR